MNHRPSPNRRPARGDCAAALVAAVTIASLVAVPMAPQVTAQAPAATTPAAAAVAPATAPDGEWPRAYTTASGAGLTIFQPQVATWANQKHAVLYAAVSYTAKGASAPALGTIRVESDTSVAV